MDYKEFLAAFYRKNRAGGLLGYRSKKKLTEFFFSNALIGDERELLPTSDDAYDRWFDGSRNPKTEVWAAIASRADTDNLEKETLKALNDSLLRELVVAFGIELLPAEVPDKRRFALAITQQFIALAEGNGTANNIIPAAYKKTPEPTGFETYIRGAINRFKWMRLPGEDEQLMDDVFVCSNIGTSAAVFPHRIRGNYIENATLEKIRTIDRRNELKHALIIGACGYGKTLMLQHLFLDAADRRNETGLLPIFAELRNFSSQQNSFIPFLVEAVQEYDRSFTEADLIGLLEKGQAQLLFDGLDEMDPEETIHFHKKLAELAHAFPNNQIIISSRYCSAINGIRGFVRLYLHPLDEAQADRLIDKLLQDVDDDKAKETILSFTKPNTGYIRKNGFVATNPMLLTIMVRKYKELQDCAGSRIKFYETMYNALIKEHDEEKQAFSRFFHSVTDGDEFTLVFREFCAKTYVDGIYEFDHRTFERYFKQLESKNELANPVKFKLNAFQHDVCATACMMYEQESGIYYIDPGFQDYFFAEYYFFADTAPTKEMGKQLRERQPDSFRSIDALMMFYQMAKDKADVCILLPYLDDIFKGQSPENAFLRFLAQGYGEVKYITLDEGIIQKYLMKSKASKHDSIVEQNPPTNIIGAMLLDVLNMPNTFAMGSYDNPVVREKFASYFLTGYVDSVRDFDKPDEEPKIVLRNMKHEIARFGDSEYFDSLERSPVPIRDENGEPVCFGYEYTVNPIKLADSPEQLKFFIEMCNKAGLGLIFARVADYYKKISEAQDKNKLR